MIQMEVSITPDPNQRTEKAKRAVKELSLEIIEKMARLAVRELKRVLNVPAHKIRRASKARGKKLTAAQLRLINARRPLYEHSKPGEPPRKITGKLRDSVSSIANKSAQNFKVVVAKLYGKYLEQGTRKMAARPYLAKTILSLIPKFLEIVKSSRRTGSWRIQTGAG